MRALVVALALAAPVALAGCSAEELAGGNCIILANGGNKLCGEDAKAWCDSTEEFRQGDPEFGIEPDTESQKVCDGL